LPITGENAEAIRAFMRRNEARHKGFQRLLKLLEVAVLTLFSPTPLLGFFFCKRILSANLPVSHPAIAEIMSKDRFFTELKTTIPISGDKISVDGPDNPAGIFCKRAYTSLMMGAAKIVPSVVPGGGGGRPVKRVVKFPRKPDPSTISNMRRAATIITENIAEKTELAEDTTPNLFLTIKPHRKPVLIHIPIKVGKVKGSPKRIKIIANNTWIDVPKKGPNHSTKRPKLTGKKVNPKLKANTEHATKAKIFLIFVSLR